MPGHDQNRDRVHNVVTGPVLAPLVQAGTITGGVHVTPHVTPVPRQLPAPPAGFTGRRHELTRLTELLDDAADRGGTVLISALSGVGGIGKTWLALHWAHRNADRFPDGQLFVDLRGFASDGAPLSAEAAMRGFLTGLGVAPDRVPPEPGAQVGLYRSLVADRRVLVVLDNAADTGQVAPLLPGSTSCAVLVTSRHHLPGLLTGHGAHALVLTELSDTEARRLLERRLGPDRLAAEPEATAELLTCCAGLPLALGIVAGRALAHPDLPLAVLAAELRDVTTRLTALDEEDSPANLTAVLSWSHAALPPDRAEAFALLGIAPGTGFGPESAATTTGLNPTGTAVLLRALERASLTQQPSPGRYRLHDLVRLHAADRAVRDLPDRVAPALRRLVDHYLCPDRSDSSDSGPTFRATLRVFGPTVRVAVGRW
ncbi:NB-ARC domain-containing protein [Saccharothrix xinjiangensis]|uniref:NB-ARC domain-containing protein n=1 Tax=Saccharothrix xinjiangensis TaxID=204798 RepID=A0ABV9XY30_9PSEU